MAYLKASGTLTAADADLAFRPGAWLRKQDKARTDGKLAPTRSSYWTHCRAVTADSRPVRTSARPDCHGEHAA
ncbi:hypothetical protein [Kitasatospora azatica]|uniref:hypothetical protein n=1 Tax=Kitasatospora azatica TaxID=58347 RepID=UPI0005676F5B|nr:hypothetical protein [Kitasatospora azatica]